MTKHIKADKPPNNRPVKNPSIFLADFFMEINKMKTNDITDRTKKVQLKMVAIISFPFKIIEI